MGYQRPYDARNPPSGRARPPHRSRDHRYARPHYRHVRPHSRARYGVPARSYYSPYYSRWYVHPYYRHAYSTTVVVGFGFNTFAWQNTWLPPRRAGWNWIPGHYNAWGWYSPGYWVPNRRVVCPTGYAYVPGWWDNDIYVEGYYRAESRPDWDWVEGYYLEDGTYVRGHWYPTTQVHEGYTWEAGFWDGETWVEGFWRPEYRKGFTWVSAYYDKDSIFHAGYWMPTQERSGSTWVPGWFDGNEWQPGYWEDSRQYGNADIEAWQPEEGWDAGWEAGDGWGDGEVIENHGIAADSEEGEVPLAMPVWFDEEALEEEDGDLPPM